MSSNSDKTTLVLIRFLDALLFRNPERTAVGVMLGFALYGIHQILLPALSSRGIVLGNPSWWAAISIGVVLVHLPFVVWSIRNKPLINDEVESLIKLIESTNIGEIERRSAYRRVVNKCIEEFSLSAGPGGIKEIIKQEIDESVSSAESSQLE